VLVANTVILATWEVDIRRIAVQGQPRQITDEPHLKWTGGSFCRAPALQSIKP
jgi:hypothetical protein